MVSTTDLEELSHCVLTVWLDRLKELQCIVRVSVNNVDTNRWVDVMRQGVFTDVTAADSEDIG